MKSSSLKVQETKRFTDVIKTWHCKFSQHFKGGQESVNDNSYKNFENMFVKTLNFYAPLKVKML